MSSNEMFYLDEHGQKQDAKLHEAMLGDDRVFPGDVERLVKLGMSFGMTRAEAKAAFGITE